MKIENVRFCEFYYTIAVTRYFKSFHDSIFEKIIEASEQQGIRLI